jgi:hypothetical protein
LSEEGFTAIEEANHFEVLPLSLARVIRVGALKKKQRDYLSIASLSEEGLLLDEEADHFEVLPLS